MSVESEKYDIFISYRFTQKAWAEVLAENLRAQGYSVFIDSQVIYAGQRFTPVIEQALRDAQHAILIATPEAAESDWVQREYDLILNLKSKKVDFNFVPVIWGDIPDFAFLDGIHAVDFKNSTKEAYHEAFQRLLCALKRQSPGANPYYQSVLKLPEPLAPVLESIESQTKEISFVQQVFTYVETSQPVMILAQDGFSPQHYVKAIKAEAEQRYGKENVLHLVPAIGHDYARYFSHLAKRCRFDASIQDAMEWQDALEEHLLSGDEIFLLISRFENGSLEAQRDFANALRALMESYPDELKLVILGEQRLAALKFEDGEMSALNRLQPIPLPSPCLADIRTLYLSRFQNMPIDDEVLMHILEFSGGHPRIIEAALHALIQGHFDWKVSIQNSQLPSQLLACIQGESEERSFNLLLQQNDLGHDSVWASDAFIRKLYWHNLLTGQNGRLVWRCEWLKTFWGNIHAST